MRQTTNIHSKLSKTKLHIMKKLDLTLRRVNVLVERVIELHIEKKTAKVKIERGKEYERLFNTC